ncbi:MAG: hypothetical protein KBA31_20465 [Alphaproteobacteria bacterium]|nr:hypothetical protein [Alphaproteobacteria bacterium]
MLSYLNANSGALTVIFTAIVTVSTVAYAVLTQRLVSETKQLRRAETEPALVVYLSPSDRWVNLFYLVIHNHGKGVARNIKWSLVPSREELTTLGVKATSLALLDGFAQLAPDQRVRSFFGSVAELLKDPPMQAIQISVSYENDARQVATANFLLDVNQFRGIVELGKAADVRIAESLEKLERNLRSVVSDGSISVLVQTLTEAKHEREKFVAEVRAMAQAERSHSEQARETDT